MTTPGPFETGDLNHSNPEPLFVKELAVALGVSTRFIYQMRACGFVMEGDVHQRQKATVAEARAWIKENNFRLIKSKGMIGGPESLQHGSRELGAML